MSYRVLQVLFRALFFPFKLLLLRKVRTTREGAEALTYASPVPGMRVEGSPPVRLSGEPAAPQVADFVTWRSPTYVGPMTDGTADNLAAVLSGQADPVPPTVEWLNEAVLKTPSAYLAERDGPRWVFDFRKTKLVTNRRITVAKYAFDPETGEAEIEDVDGRTHRPGDATWERALLHMTAWWGTYTVGGLHNWVHFHLPDTMAEAHARLTNPDGVLGRFLAPHVRFTTRINYAGLWLNQSSHNPDNWKRVLRPWAGLPFDSSEFQDGIVTNTGRHYEDLPGHFALPDTLDDEVPYFATLKAWFPPFERFVQRVDEHIDDADWGELLILLRHALPGIEEIPRARVLAQFAWQVGVVHVHDHMSFSLQFRDRGFYCPPESIDEPFTVRDIAWWDRWKVLNCNDVFYRYNPNPKLNNHLVDVENYGFEGELADAARDFRRELRDVAADLERRELLILPPESLPQSVCF